MRGIRTVHALPFAALMLVCAALSTGVHAQRKGEPRLRPAPATRAAPAAGDEEGASKVPVKKRRVDPPAGRKVSCIPDVQEVIPAGCLSPGVSAVTLRGSCFGDVPGSRGAAVRTTKGTVHAVDHRRWSDKSITLTLPSLPALSPGAEAELGVSGPSSEWVDGEAFTVCGALEDVGSAVQARRGILRSRMAPGPALKKRDGGDGAARADRAKATAGIGGKRPPQQKGGGMIGQKLYNDPPLPPKITVTAPTAGEALTEGDVRTVTWQHQGLPPGTCFNLWLYRGKPRQRLIQPNVCATSWNWNVPGIPYGAYWNIAVETVDTKIIGHSPHFTVFRAVADPYIDKPRVLPATPQVGETARFTARIHNFGGAPPVQNSAVLEVTGPNGYHETYSYAFPPLQPRNPASLFVVNQPYTVPAPGPYYNELTVTFDGGPGEVIFPASTKVPFYIEHRPDLVACLPNSWYIQTLRERRIPISVKNVGTARSPETTMAVYLEGKGISYHAVPPLDPGQRKEITYPKKKWYFPKTLTMIASVDNEEKVSELVEDNNRRCTEVKVRYGKQYNTSGYPPCSDLHPCSTPMPVVGGN